MGCDTAVQALSAEEAGRLLANLLGLPEPITRERMWYFARQDHVPAIRLGKRLYFRNVDLEAFVARGGTPPELK